MSDDFTAAVRAMRDLNMAGVLRVRLPNNFTVRSQATKDAFGDGAEWSEAQIAAMLSKPGAGVVKPGTKVAVRTKPRISGTMVSAFMASQCVPLTNRATPGQTSPVRRRGWRRPMLKSR